MSRNILSIVMITWYGLHFLRKSLTVELRNSLYEKKLDKLTIYS